MIPAGNQEKGTCVGTQSRGRGFILQLLLEETAGSQRGGLTAVRLRGCRFNPRLRQEVAQCP